MENLLPLIQRPSRYIDHELNSHHKEGAGVRVCLCFPDLYELGASNLGIEILYHLVNARKDALAERCYAPGDDLEAALREKKLPLASLESRTPLAEFDIVGISLPYELCATNALNMLDLAGLPFRSADRKEAFPLVIGGGPLTGNPEPLADFFDAFVIGEGEDAIGEIIEQISNFKSHITKKSKKDLLLELAKLDGVYVPSLYSVEYNADNTVKSVKPSEMGVPGKVNKRTVKLEDAFFPAKQLVPYVQTVHNRLNIEIARGCARSCRFCQASRYYKPWRLRSKERIMELVDEGLEATGFENLSLSSLSCTDYRGLDALLAEISGKYAAQRLSISLPSLRCDRFSVVTAASLSGNKKSSLTFAPEAGTARLRKVIDKEISEKDVRETLMLAHKMGWSLVKLYFMVGLPTETDADVEGINKLVRSVKGKTPRLNFNVTVSPFVPKAQTAFQWAPMAGEQVLKERTLRLRKSLPASVKSHELDGSLLEAVLARGDRRLGAGILAAHRRGCRFDQWGERLNFTAWKEAFAEAGLDMAFYGFRERPASETLPWEHIVFGAEKEELRRDYEESLAAAADGEEPELSEPEVPAAAQAPRRENAPQPSVQRVRVCVSRRGIVRFLSHLEQIEVFRRAVRRSGLPVAYSAGFHPQPKIAFGPPNSVGYESESEFAEAEFTKRVNIEEARAALQKALPAGFTVVSARSVPVMFPSLESLVNIAAYRVSLPVEQGKIDEFLARPEIVVEKMKDGAVKKINAKPLIRSIKPEPGGINMLLRFGKLGNVKPEKIIQLMTGMGEEEVKLLKISRKALFIEKPDGALQEL